MPIILHKNIEPEGEVGVWKIEESEEWFRKRLDLYEEEKDALSQIKGEGKRREWLASRWLLHEMSGRDVRGACLKDAFGKPHLAESDYEISLSHSDKIAAVMASPNPCGVDIQLKVEKITRLAKRFVNEYEQNWIESVQSIEDLHLIWGAKEALYKTYSKGKVDFINDLRIVNVDRKNKTATGIITKLDELHCTLQYEWIKNYLLVYAQL